MGMKPEGVACEFHLPVPFEHYPQKLSELDLDLALVPLEQNRFNECKSNLRLLDWEVADSPLSARISSLIAVACPFIG